MTRDYNIPDSKIGFYGTGLYGLSELETQALRSIIEPMAEYFLPKLTPHHISCRYLGYFDEYPPEEILKIGPVLAQIYKKYLPFRCRTGKLFSSWEKRPDTEKKLLMVEIISPQLVSLHRELLEATKSFRIFEDVEDRNMRPHISIGRVKEDITITPDELQKIINEKNSELDLTFTKAYIFTPGGVKEIKV
jgi:2'-5' RNA ligase